MAQNVLYADLNLPEPTGPRILTVPDVQGCTYAELKVKSQDTNAAASCKSSGQSWCSRKRVAILAVIILVLVLAVYFIITYVATADSQNGSTTLTSANPTLSPTSQQDSTTLTSTSEQDSTTLTSTRQQDSTTSSPTSKNVSTTLTSTSQQFPKTLSPTIMVEAPGCPPSWKKHGTKCYFFSPEKKKQDWKSSREECAAMGSDLVIIDSKEELNYLLSESKYGYYLLGLTYSQEEQKWKWINNMEHDPNLFGISRPYSDYNCLTIGYDRVGTAPCNGSGTTQILCEKAATMSKRHQKES